ncbi:MAG: PilZ domain-containing protein [Candidatus Omnitrophica bacterium]|nr:PilZ domain-containing protein [Candidatus Omnitrophota bacterium]
MFAQYEKRQSNRIRFHEPVQYQLKKPGHFGGCLSCDLSVGGLQINFSQFVPVGTEMLLTVPLGREQIVECEGKVAWVEQLADDRFHVGVKFVQDTFSSKVLKKFLE